MSGGKKRKNIRVIRRDDNDDCAVAAAAIGKWQ